MARTKKTTCDDHRRTAKDAAAAEQRAARRRARTIRAATIMSSQEVAERDAMEPGAQAAAGTDEDAHVVPDAAPAPASEPRSVFPDWVWDILDPPAESTAAYAYPEPNQVIKLSAQANGSGGFKWRGRLRGGGADVQLAGTWVRKNIKGCVSGTPTSTACLQTLTPALDRRSPVPRYFRRSVQAAGGRFVHIPTGNSQRRPALVSSALGGEGARTAALARGARPMCGLAPQRRTLLACRACCAPRAGEECARVAA